MGKSLLSKVFICTSAILVFTALSQLGSLYVGNPVKASGKTKDEKVTIHFMSNLPDRQSGQGLIEQRIADQYMKENPNVTIKFETLQDVAFQQKFKVYLSLNEVPDIFMTWTGPEFDLAQKVSAAIDPKEFKGYGFNPGALETRRKNGLLYGIPKDNDMYFIYYNKSIFDKYKIKVPTTFKELLSVCKQLRSHGIIPCSTNGKDKWELSGLYTDIYYRVNPDPYKHAWNWDNAAFSKDVSALKTMNYFKQLMDAGFFQDGFGETDYGSAKDLFTSGKAAMYYMGTWELGMASETKLSAEFRRNLEAMTFPLIEGESKDTSVLTKWYGGGYSIYKDSPVKQQALDFLKYFFKPENWAQMVWDNGISISTQSFKPDKNNNELMKSVYDILIKTDKYKGKYPLTKKAESFVIPSRELIKEFCMGLLSPSEYLKRMDQGLRASIKNEK